MIQNLNRLSFQSFGTILPETPESTGWKQPWKSYSLNTHSSPTWQAVQDVWLSCEKGMAVLSVSSDGKQFQDFYLDKPVKILSGVFYGLCAFHHQAVVKCASPAVPLPMAERPLQGSYYISRQLNVDRLYTFFYQEKERGFLFPGESHSVVEFTYVDQGSLHSVADGQDILLQQGDFMLYAPNQWHMQYADIHIAPRFMTVTFDAGTYDLSDLYNRKFQSSQNTTALLQKMLWEQENTDSFSGDMLLLYLSQLLLLLKRQANKPADALKSVHCLTNENEIIRKAQQYISTHIRSKLTVPLVAKNTDVSTSYLTALFHKHLQLSPGEYIRRIKLQESKQMIRDGSMNFTEIADALHYSTIHHFSRQFKEKFGVTPSQYAKSIR